MLSIAQDRPIVRASNRQPDGLPRDDTGAIIPAALGVSATFTSRWYPRGEMVRLLVLFYGSQTGTLRVQETFSSDPNTLATEVVHQQYDLTPTAKTTVGGSDPGARFIGQLEARLLCPFFRISFVNGATVQAGAVLYAVLSTP